MVMQNAPLQALRRPMVNTELENKDPAAWFRADPDIWAPPIHRDPDVFGAPIDRSIQRPQRPSTNKKVDNRRGPPSKSGPAGKDAKGVTKKSASQGNSARGSSKDGAKKGGGDAQGKDEDNKEEDPPEEEKRFEAANHMEGDLVDILGKRFANKIRDKSMSER